MVSAIDVGRARLGGVLALAERSDAYRDLASRLEDRQRLIVADANAGARAFAWSALVAENARTVALVAPSEDRARRWRAELAGWLGEERVLAFPERETMPFEAGAPSGTAVHQRLLTLWRLATAHVPVAVVTSLRALLEHTIPPDDLARRGRTLRAGDRLTTRELADRFGVSHTPVREALIALSGMGIIDLEPNRGAVVRRVSRQEVREVCQVRRALECEATRSACGRIDLAELHALAAELRRLMAARSLRGARFIDQARALDSRLHDLIADSCGNAFLAQEISRLKTLFRVFRDVAWAHDQACNDYHRLAEEAREHLAIVEALLAGDARAAARAMARHIRSGLRYWSRAVPAPADRLTLSCSDDCHVVFVGYEE